MTLAVPPAPVRHGVDLRLLDVDRELLQAVPAEQRALARRLPLATLHRIPADGWDVGFMRARDGRRPVAAIVLSGVLVREVELAGRFSAELLGPGDVVHASRSSSASLAHMLRWCALQEATIAVLDARFARASATWPGLAAVVHDRLIEQLEVASLRAAIVCLPRAEQRILALLWHLAERWGTVGSAEVTVHLALTHELIGRLIGAQRPTVSLAIATLAERGQLRAAGKGEWRLARGSADEVELVCGRRAAPA